MAPASFVSKCSEHRFIPKPLAPTLTLKMPPPAAHDACGCAVPIWGNTTNALVHGGPWDPHKRPKPDGKRRTIPTHEGPEPAPPEGESNNEYTTEILRYMFRAGWSLGQVTAALDNPRHKGGGYARWKALLGPKYLDHLWQHVRNTETSARYGAPSGRGSNSTPPCTSSITPSSPAIGDHVSVSQISGKGDFKIHEATKARMIAFVSQHPNLTQGEMLAQCGVHSRINKSVMRELEREGRIAPTKRQNPATGRTATFWAITAQAEQAKRTAALSASLDLPRLLDISEPTVTTYRSWDDRPRGPVSPTVSYEEHRRNHVLQKPSAGASAPTPPRPTQSPQVDPLAALLGIALAS